VKEQQLYLPGIKVQCTSPGCREEIDYDAYQLDEVELCFSHWEQWSNEMYKNGETQEQ